MWIRGELSGRTKDYQHWRPLLRCAFRTAEKLYVKRKHQVFICSTFIDLKDQRQDLFVELYRNGFIPIGMEGFTPANQGQLRYIKDRIDECDYFVVIVADRYGTESPDVTSGESITEYEYNYALSKGTIPISRFVISESAAWPRDKDHRSTGDQQRRLAEFKERLGRTDRDTFSTNPWSDGKDLVQKVITASNAMRAEVPRPGLIKPTGVSTAAERFGIDELFGGLRTLSKQEFLVGHKTLWIVINDGYNFFEANLSHISSALTAGTAVRILLVHPESPCLEAIADKSNKSLKQQRNDIIRTVRLLLGSFGGFANFKLLGHKQFNTYFGLINEQECLVDFYFNFRLEHGRQDDRIALKCSASQEGDPLHRRIKDDFENFWRETESRDDSNLGSFA